MENAGIKSLVQGALQAAPAAMTMGQIMGTAGIPKTSAGEVSAALYKLRNAGHVKVMRGPATAPKGPRFVRMYQWITRPSSAGSRDQPRPMHHLAGIFRI